MANNKIYAIRNTETGEFERFNGRVAWANKAAAKSSYLASFKYYTKFIKFEDQDKYVFVELTEVYNKWIGNYETVS